jgi:hypothetical protein
MLIRPWCARRTGGRVVDLDERPVFHAQRCLYRGESDSKPGNRDIERTPIDGVRDQLTQIRASGRNLPDMS